MKQRLGQWSKGLEDSDRLRHVVVGDAGVNDESSPARRDSPARNAEYFELVHDLAGLGV